MPNTSPVVIVIGASAGGLDPLLTIVRQLPADLPAVVCVVMHFPAHANSLLPKILTRAGALPAQHPEEGQPLQAGCIYTARPDHHLLVQDGHLALSRGPRQNGHRPAIDPLFASAARSHGPRSLAVILSGTQDDGTLGLKRIKDYGGVTIVQDPADAVFDAMPRNALAITTPDYVLPAEAIAPVLVALAHERADWPAETAAARKSDAMHDPYVDDSQARAVAEETRRLENGARSGEATMFTCPDCGGVLWEFADDQLLRYRCHVGHAYSADGLRAQQSDALEEALWTAVRRLEESASLARRLAHRARHANHQLTATHFDTRAVEDEARAELVRQALMVGTLPPESEVLALDSGGNTGA